MTAALGVEPAGQPPAPGPTRALSFLVSGGGVRVRDGHGQLPATLDAVVDVLAGTVRRPEPAPVLHGRRPRAVRTPRLPRQRHWYARPLPTVLAAGGLVTVTATGLAELAPSAGVSGILTLPAQRGPDGTLRGARILPEPAPTPDEVPPRTARPAAVPATPGTAATPAAAPTSGPVASPTTVRPKRTRTQRRSRTTPTSGPAVRPTGSATRTPAPTGDPTGEVTIGPP